MAIDRQYRGSFQLASTVRPETDKLMATLQSEYALSLLSGDNDQDRERFTALLGSAAQLHFNQSPHDKLAFIQRLQESGRRVIMVGDGLNDAGALQQCDIGIAVVENVGAFSPASDVIMAAAMVPHLGRVARFARAASRVVRLSFLLSSLYNVVGISIAARGLLAPIVCAVLMPLSSVTVVAFACGATTWLGWKILGPTSTATKSTGTGSTEQIERRLLTSPSSLAIFAETEAGV
jgi:Cu+-exporting ATPase